MALVATGCAKTTAPPEWRVSARQADQSTHGAWIKLMAGPSAATEGEFIAHDRDSVFVQQGDHLVVWPDSLVSKAKLTAYDSEWRSVRGWAAFGTVSTLSHGFGLVLTAPVWILLGSATVGSASYAGEWGYPAKSWAELSMFARHPQGLPEGLDRAHIGIPSEVERRRTPR